MIMKFYEHEKYACIYYAYSTIQKYLVSCLYKFWMLKYIEFIDLFDWIIHDSCVLNTVYLHSSWFLCDRTLCFHHHNSCVLEHYVYIFMTLVCCLYLLCGAYVLEQIMLTFFMTHVTLRTVYLHSSLLLCCNKLTVLVFLMTCVLEHSVTVLLMTLLC